MFALSLTYLYLHNIAVHTYKLLYKATHKLNYKRSIKQQHIKIYMETFQAMLI